MSHQSQTGNEPVFSTPESSDHQDLNDGQKGVIEQVKKYTLRKGYKNREFRLEREVKVGEGYVFAVSFAAEKADYRITHYLLRYGDADEFVILEELETLINQLNIIRVPLKHNRELIKLYLLSVIALTLTAATIMAVFLVDNVEARQSIPLLTTLVGSIIGYLIGDRTSSGEAK